MEAIDVDDGEYTAALTETGRVIKMRTENWTVVLELTDELDPDVLHRLLRAHGQAIGQPGIEQDPVGFANQSWKFEWDHSWPRWPRWPDNQLHPRQSVGAPCMESRAAWSSLRAIRPTQKTIAGTSARPASATRRVSQGRVFHWPVAVRRERPRGFAGRGERCYDQREFREPASLGRCVTIRSGSRTGYLATRHH